MLFQAGSSEAGKAFAAREADAIFTSQGSLADAVQFAHDVKQRAAQYGRNPQEMVIFPGCSPLWGTPRRKPNGSTRRLPV